MKKEHEDIVNEARHRGPNLGGVGIVYAVLFLASLATTAILTKGDHIPFAVYFWGPGAIVLYQERRRNELGCVPAVWSLGPTRNLCRNRRKPPTVSRRECGRRFHHSVRRLCSIPVLNNFGRVAVGARATGSRLPN